MVADQQPDEVIQLEHWKNCTSGHTEELIHIEKIRSLQEKLISANGDSIKS